MSKVIDTELLDNPCINCSKSIYCPKSTICKAYSEYLIYLKAKNMSKTIAEYNYFKKINNG